MSMNKEYTWQDVYKANGLQDPWAYASSSRLRLIELYQKEGYSFNQAIEDIARRSGRTTYLVAQAVAAHLMGYTVKLKGANESTTLYMKQTFDRLSKPFETKLLREAIIYEDHTVKEFGYSNE